ncbi:MAG TPA: hypothetical protein VGG88_13340 [Gaiellaceae bacterium]|jgi:hypothetical protein
MRRLAILCLPLIALAAPATALALRAAAGDGTLVIKNGSAPRGVTVVTLSINGTAIGHVSTGSPGQFDKVVIYDANNTGDIGASGTNGAQVSKTSSASDQKTTLVGSDFRFRAAGGYYKIWIYGSGVDLLAVGAGKVTLQGLPDSSTDGRYAIDGGDWRSLPAVPSDLLHFGTSG